MNRLKLVALVLLLFFCLPALRAQSKQASPSPADSLKPVAWFVGGTWMADVNPPDGKVVHVENRVRWAANKSAIEFNVNFNGEPHYNGFYAYDPARKVVGFWYTDPSGNFTNGTVQPDPDGKTLRQEFTIAHSDGHTENLRSTLFHDSENSYLFTVLGNRNGTWTQEFQVRYQRKAE